MIGHKVKLNEVESSLIFILKHAVELRLPCL